MMSAKGLAFVVLIALVLGLPGSASPVGAQDGPPTCEIVYFDVVDGVPIYVGLPVGCVAGPNTPTAPLKDAPTGYTLQALAGPCLAPVGPTVRFLLDSAIYYAPDGRTGTPWVIPAGNTAQRIGEEGSFMQIVWACQVVWVRTAWDWVNP